MGRIRETERSDREERMTRAQAYLIFRDLANDKYTVEEKGYAIHLILSLATMNGITKVELVNALNWLWHQHFELKAEEATT